MTNTYRIEMMTTIDRNIYLSGANNYKVKVIEVIANSKEEAVAIAKANNTEMVINEYYVKSLAELAEEARMIEENRRTEEEKKAKTKARKEAREKEKAEELGLTLEEYKEKIKRERKIRNAEARIAELEAELAKEKKYLENLREGA